MSWRDRPYAEPEYGGRPELRIQFRRPSTVVGWLIAINVAAFFVDLLLQSTLQARTHQLLGLSLRGITGLYLWQPITYMFVHGGVFHLLINMLMLYVCGTEFERAFGRRRFLEFYFACGIVGGLAYLGFAAVKPVYAAIPLIGASGAGYGLLMAAVIFFPHIQVILFIIPMPIRVFALIALGTLLMLLLSPGGLPNPGGEVCHVAGAAAALLIFRRWGIMPRITIGSGTGLPGGSFLSSIRRRVSTGAWARRQKRIADENAEVDRILAKVHDHGVSSLSRAEKKTLARATRRQQEQERRFDHSSRL
jgi:membrane associated rhomboid family serine protease